MAGLIATDISIEDEVCHTDVVAHVDDAVVVHVGSLIVEAFGDVAHDVVGNADIVAHIHRAVAVGVALDDNRLAAFAEVDDTLGRGIVVLQGDGLAFRALEDGEQLTIFQGNFPPRGTWPNPE